MLLHFFHHGFLHLVMRAAGHLHDFLRTEVRGHHDHGVLEVHRAALTIRHAAIVLQQDVEDVRVSLFDFIEQDHAVGTAPDSFREVAALVIADISRRRADQTGDAMLLHVFRHINADHGLFTIEEERGERLRELGLADTRGSKEEERAVRPVRVRESCAASLNRFRDLSHGLILTDHAFRQFLTHVKELLTLALHHFRHRDAGRAGHHFSDFLSADACTKEVRLIRRLILLHLARFLIQLLLKLREHRVLEFREALVLSVPAALVHLAADLIDLVAGFLFADRVRLLALPDLFEV